MTNYWFKFYGPEYLSDQKLLGMDGNTRSCWITLLCYACKDGPEIEYLSEEQLMIHAGVPMGGEDWEKTRGVLQKFQDRGMIDLEENKIIVLNWDKRQETHLTNAERQARYRERNGEVTGHVTKVTLEKRREEKKEKRESKPTASISYLSDIPQEKLKELTETYEASTAQVKKKALDLVNYCAARGKTYKNYHAFLENALSKDFGRRAKLQPKVEEIEMPLDAEALARVAALKVQIGQVAKAKTL